MEFTYLNNLNISNLDINNEISVIDGDHCTSRETKFTINIISSSCDSSPKAESQTINIENNNFEFTITGENNEYIRGSFINESIILKTKDNKSIFYVKDNNWKVDKKEIYDNEKQENIISEVKPKDRGSYKVDFVNLAKEKSDFFEVVSDKNLLICDIFYGERIKEVPLICKVIRKGNNCDVIMASGVDYHFILGLASIFFCNRSNNSYDKIAQFEMPSNPLIENKYRSKDKLNDDYNCKEPNEIEIGTVMDHKKITLCQMILCCFCFERCYNHINKSKENKDIRNTLEVMDEVNGCCEDICDICECCEACKCNDCNCNCCNCDDCCECDNCCDCNDCDCGDCGDCGGGDCGGCAIM